MKRRLTRLLPALVICAIGCGDPEEEAAAADVGAASDAAGAEDTMAPDVGEDIAAPLPDPGPAVVDVADVPDEGERPEVDVEEIEDVPVVPDVSEDAGPVEDVAADVAEDAADTAPQGIGALCFGEIFDPDVNGPNYDQFEITPAEHCFGTNHQAIEGVQRVVFLGDSVTVGTPSPEHLLNVDNEHFWRNKLASWLADELDLEKGDVFSWGTWKTYDYFTGQGGKIETGSFKNCSKWGARNDDLISGGGQIPQCFPGYPDFGDDEVTLVVFTMGGNDISKISQTGQEATPEEVEAGYPEAWGIAEDSIAYLEEAVAWLSDPVRFPAGSHVVFANPFEFTDSTGKTGSCKPKQSLVIPGIGEFDLSTIDVSLAELAGYGEWEKPEVQEAIVIWMMEEYMRIAAQYDVDLIWMLEHFCGHGFVATGPEADPENRCYRGSDAELWFDDTCIHPNAAGHHAIYEMFKAIISE